MLTAYGRSTILTGLLIPEFSPHLRVLYASLLTEPLRQSDTGKTISEVVGGGYGRVPIPLSKEYWAISDDGSATNTSAIVWNSAADDWGRVSGWALMTSAHEGDAVMGGALAQSIMVTAGVAIAIDIGGITTGVL